ncbi:DUF4145 domain-containing protein [Pseudonocardia sp. WMMC193]|uniref:DUF4145 domain-containing protein n=1 Tax=Pseudonocardia sp. WMMC193 TaxID=2911965 RepID=UPI001F2A8523|nr:DUF4145 domain-containing protein [Pseudonocardia sp. WMMC193]MCF7552218.1 DUF4145 domain-containing protein [Pseudonocardia sp. WMMC193]
MSDDPQFYMARCFQCEGRTQFVRVYDGADQSGGYGDIAWYIAAECVVCRLLLTGRATQDGAFHVIENNRTLRGKRFEDVPKHIAEAASEAHKSMDAECYRGAVILARAVIESTAKDKGITGGNIASKIERMEKEDLIRPYVREGADEVRVFGNDMAHGDFVQEVGYREVQLALELMDEVLAEVYQGPARVKKARERKAKLSEGGADQPTPGARAGSEVVGRTGRPRSSGFVQSSSPWS